MEWQPFWEWWVSMVPDPVEPEPSAWDLEKSRNRLQRMTEKIENRRWVPKYAYRVTGKALQELRAARALLDESGQALQEARR